jgi:hypothetical protein
MASSWGGTRVDPREGRVILKIINIYNIAFIFLRADNKGA